MWGILIPAMAQLATSFFTQKSYDDRTRDMERQYQQRLAPLRQNMEESRAQMNGFLDSLGHTDYGELLNHFNSLYKASPADEYARKSAVQSIEGLVKNSGLQNSQIGLQEIANTSALAASQGMQQNTANLLNLFSNDRKMQASILTGRYQNDLNSYTGLEGKGADFLNTKTATEGAMFKDSANADNMFKYTSSRYLKDYIDKQLGMDDGKGSNQSE